MSIGLMVCESAVNHSHVGLCLDVPVPLFGGNNNKPNQWSVRNVPTPNWPLERENESWTVSLKRAQFVRLTMIILQPTCQRERQNITYAAAHIIIVAVASSSLQLAKLAHLQPS